MSEHPLEPLNKICDINPDTLSETADASRRYRYIDLSSIKEQKADLSIAPEAFAELPSRARRKVRRNDVLLGTVRPNLKNFALIDSGDDDLLCSTGFAVLRSKKDISDPRFIFQAINSEVVERQLNALVTGSNYPAVNSGQVAELLIPVPPLPEQKKIAEILSGVQTEREAVKKEIQKVDHLERCLHETLLKEQEGWQKVSVSDLGRVIRGASPRPKGDPRYYGGNIPRLMVADVTRDGKYVTPRIDFLTEAGARLSRPVPAGTLTIVCSGVVGVPSILSVDACIHDGFLAITDTTPDCMVEYLFYYFKPLQQILDSSATHGGIFTNLTTEILKDFPVTLPPLETQRKIVQKLRGIDAYRRALTSKVSKVEFLLMSVSADLLSGRKRVSV